MNTKTKKKVEKKQKPDEEILFPEVEVAGIIVKPWSFGMLFKLGPFVEEILGKLEEKEIDLEQGFLSYTTMAKLFTIATEPVLKVISLTTDTSEEDIKELSLSDGIKIAYIIYNQNREQIVKNLTSPI